MKRKPRDRLAGRRPHRTERRARLVVELLEDRLTPSWAGVPPATITPPTSAPQVFLNSQGDAGGFGSIVSGEVDYYRFTALAGGSYTFSATDQSGTLDTVLGVFGGGGQRLGYNDDIVPYLNTDSRLTLNLTAGKNYYLGITNYARTPGGSYAWSINGPTPPPQPVDDSFENNDTLAQAAPLGPITQTQTFPGLAMLDAADFYSFSIPAQGVGGSVSISFLQSQGDLDMKLFNSNGTRIGLSDGVGDGEAISLSGLAAGTYFVDVYGYNGAHNPSYSLTITPPNSPSGGGGTGAFHIALTFSGLSATQQQVFQQAAARWEQIITGPAETVTIDASARSIDGVDGILGESDPDTFAPGTHLPTHGVMEFDTADLNQLRADGQLQSVIIHEMAHVLGFGTIWHAKGLLSGAGTTHPRFTGAQATAAFDQIFGRSATSVPVEGGGGAGTRNSHWRESVFGDELMTGFLDPGFNPLSRITIASMADLGYQVNLNAADPFTPRAAAVKASGGTTSTGGQAALMSALDSTDLLASLSPGEFNSFWALMIAPNGNGPQSPVNGPGNASSGSGQGGARSLILDAPAASTRTSSSAFLTGSAHENPASEGDDTQPPPSEEELAESDRRG